MDSLDTSIEFLKGVGPNRAKLIRNELRIHTFGDLLYRFPFRYVNKTKYHKISELSGHKDDIQVIGKISKLQEVGSGRKKRLIAEFSDDTGSIQLIWFKSINWIKESLEINKYYIVFGKANLFNGLISIAHPELEKYTHEKTKKRTKFYGIYSSTEVLIKKGVTNKVYSKLIDELLIKCANKVEENLPAYILKKYNLLGKRDSLIAIHKPNSKNILNKAIIRLKFEEIFYLQLRFIFKKNIRKEKIKGYSFPVIGKKFDSFFNNFLDFDLTNAQKKVIKEIRNDLGSGTQMNRLLQGDVGSGKTIVAFMSTLIAIGNGYQACIMTPTEILSYQHYNKFIDVCNLLNINVSVLTGSSKLSYKKRVKNELKSGKINLIIGTHSLIYDEVIFKNLGLAVIDEQHKLVFLNQSVFLENQLILNVPYLYYEKFEYFFYQGGAHL